MEVVLFDYLLVSYVHVLITVQVITKINFKLVVEIIFIFLVFIILIVKIWVDDLYVPYVLLVKLALLIFTQIIIINFTMVF